MLWGPLLLISAASFLIAQLVWRHIERSASPDERYSRAWETDDDAVAEGVAWKMVKAHPDALVWWLRFMDAHIDAIDESENGTSAIGERAIQEQLGKVHNAKTLTIAAFWYEQQTKEGDANATAVTRLAEANPPARYANFVLARIASSKKDWCTAASRYEREGLAFRDSDQRNLRRAMRLWTSHNDWRDARARINDPRYANAIDAGTRLDFAVHERDWLRVLLWAWPAGYSNVSAWPVALALLAGILWFWISTRLGRIHDDDVSGRVLLYVTAFVLGVLSVYPTLITLTIEEEFFALRELGQFVPDLIYYVFGVGLREEGCKMLLFLPLLPALLRRGSRIEAMTCGALVGLGFAAEENIGYFTGDAGSAPISRFLTANFLHMSLTALVALAAFDTLRKRATSRDAFNVVFPLAVGIHGAYDFCLTTRELPLSSIISIVLLIIIARRFLRQLLIASSREEERDALNLFVASMAAITGAAYIYATTLVGPSEAFKLIALGTLSVAVMIFIFVRELSG